MQRFTAIALLTAALVGGAALAQADPPKGGADHDVPTPGVNTSTDVAPREVADIQRDARIDLSQAVRIAEEHCNGKAARAMLLPESEARPIVKARAAEGHSGSHPVYDVIVLADGKFACVQVCGETGKVLSRTNLDGDLRVNLASYDVGTRSRQTHVSTECRMPARWQKVSDLIHKTSVKNRQDEALGKLEDLAIDPGSGRVLYGITCAGGIPELGERCFGIPWGALAVRPDAREAVVNIERDRLKRANGFPHDSWPNMADERWSRDTLRHFDLEPYWQTVSDERNSEADRSKMTRTARQNARWRERSATVMRATEMLQKSVKSMNNADDLGKLEELVIDPDNGRVLCGVIVYRNQMFAIPWSLWELRPGGEHWTLNIEKNQLDNAKIGFNRDKWPDLASEQVLRDSAAAFGEPVYFDRDTQ